MDVFDDESVKSFIGSLSEKDKKIITFWCELSCSWDACWLAHDGVCDEAFRKFWKTDNREFWGTNVVFDGGYDKIDVELWAQDLPKIKEKFSSYWERL